MPGPGDSKMHGGGGVPLPWRTQGLAKGTDTSLSGPWGGLIHGFLLSRVSTQGEPVRLVPGRALICLSA